MIQLTKDGRTLTDEQWAELGIMTTDGMPWTDKEWSEVLGCKTMVEYYERMLCIAKEWDGGKRD